jgi:hypothetical protein
MKRAAGVEMDRLVDELMDKMHVSVDRAVEDAMRSRIAACIEEHVPPMLDTQLSLSHVLRKLQDDKHVYAGVSNVVMGITYDFNWFEDRVLCVLTEALKGNRVRELSVPTEHGRESFKVVLKTTVRAQSTCAANIRELRNEITLLQQKESEVQKTNARLGKIESVFGDLIKTTRTFQKEDRTMINNNAQMVSLVQRRVESLSILVNDYEPTRLWVHNFDHITLPQIQRVMRNLAEASQQYEAKCSDLCARFTAEKCLEINTLNQRILLLEAKVATLSKALGSES